MRLLIAEDEVDLAEALTVFLRKIIFQSILSMMDARHVNTLSQASMT